MKKQASYTPGPWIVDGYSVWAKTCGDVTTRLLAVDWKKYSPPYDDGFKTDAPTAIANAQLIATAPEMFELLEDLDMILGTAIHGHHDLVQRVKQVLKKARGE